MIARALDKCRPTAWRLNVLANTFFTTTDARKQVTIPGLYGLFAEHGPTDIDLRDVAGFSTHADPPELHSSIDGLGWPLHLTLLNICQPMQPQTMQLHAEEMGQAGKSVRVPFLTYDYPHEPLLMPTCLVTLRLGMLVASGLKLFHFLLAIPTLERFSTTDLCVLPDLFSANLIPTSVWPSLRLQELAFAFMLPSPEALPFFFDFLSYLVNPSSTQSLTFRSTTMLDADVLDFMQRPCCVSIHSLAVLMLPGSAASEANNVDLAAAASPLTAYCNQKGIARATTPPEWTHWTS